MEPLRFSDVCCSKLIVMKRFFIRRFLSRWAFSWVLKLSAQTLTSNYEAVGDVATLSGPRFGITFVGMAVPLRC